MTSALPTPDASRTAAERFVAGNMLADRFRYVDRLGEGGMGEVYKAEDVLLWGLPVALKFLPREKELDPRSLEVLLRELQFARQIADEHVCRLWDVERHVEDGKTLHFITMELLEGGSLEELLRKTGGRLPEERVRELALELCQGLAAIHKGGMLHRDFKPSNVMFDAQDRAVITDFGLAVPASAAVRQAEIAGTPDYMAPEQLLGSAMVESDLYALALVLYEMLTGAPPFPIPQGTAAEKVAALRELRQVPPAPPSNRVRIEDPRLEEVILRALEPRPMNRIPSAQHMAAAPRGEPAAAAAGAPGGGPPPGTTLPSTAGPTADPGSRRGDPVAAWLECVAGQRQWL